MKPLDLGPLDVLAALRLESGARWGEVATPEQWEDARAVFGDGPRRHWLGRSRGYSKTTDVAGFTIAAMVTDEAPPGAQAIAAAGDHDQARLLSRAMSGFARRTPELRGVIKVQANRVYGPGVTLEIVASDASTTYGIIPWWLVVDELCQWPWTAAAEEFFSDALMPSLVKTPGSRCLIMTTAGRPGSWQHRVYKHALSEPDLWRVSDIPGAPPWLPQSEIEAERRRLPDAAFARWFENRWVESADALASAADIEAAVTHDGPLDAEPGLSYVVGVDLGTRHDPSVAVIAHRLDPANPIVIVDRVQVWQGSRKEPVDLTAVEAWLRGAAKTYNGAKVRIESWQGSGMAQRLPYAEEIFPTQTDGSKRTTALMLALRDRRLRIPKDQDLVDELLSVVVIETAPNVYRVDHRAGGHNDRAIALSLAAEPLLRAFDGTASSHLPTGRLILDLPSEGAGAASGWGSFATSSSVRSAGVHLQDEAHWTPAPDSREAS